METNTRKVLSIEWYREYHKKHEFTHSPTMNREQHFQWYLENRILKSFNGYTDNMIKWHNERYLPGYHELLTIIRSEVLVNKLENDL